MPCFKLFMINLLTFLFLYDANEYVIYNDVTIQQSPSLFFPTPVM